MVFLLRLLFYTYYMWATRFCSCLDSALQKKIFSIPSPLCDFPTILFVQVNLNMWLLIGCSVLSIIVLCILWDFRNHGVQKGLTAAQCEVNFKVEIRQQQTTSWEQKKESEAASGKDSHHTILCQGIYVRIKMLFLIILSHCQPPPLPFLIPLLDHWHPALVVGLLFCFNTGDEDKSNYKPEKNYEQAW